MDAYLIRKGLSLRGYFDESREALLDEEHQVRLNYEGFFFADLAGKERFLSALEGYCGLLTDPVTKRRFRPKPTSPRAEHEGVLYLFSSSGAYERFVTNPERWRLPGWTM